MLISSLCSYFHPMNVFIWQKSHFVDKYVQNAKFSKWQKSNLHRALRGRTITAPHKSIEYIGLHMTIFLHNHTKMKLFTHWNVEIRSGTLLSSIYCTKCARFPSSIIPSVRPSICFSTQLTFQYRFFEGGEGKNEGGEGIRGWWK